MSGGIPSRRFRTLETDKVDQFGLYHDHMRPIYDVSSDGGSMTGFAADMTAYHMGGMLVGASGFSDHTIGRSKRKIARTDMDHFLVQLHQTGGLTADADGNPMRVGAGDVSLIDLGRPLEGHASASQTIDVIMPRAFLPELARMRQTPHGTVLSGEGVMGGILGDFLSSMARRLDVATARDAGLLTRAAADLITTCFQLEPVGARATEGLNLAASERARRYIDANLSKAELVPERVAREVRMSRSSLYRLFEPEGGIATYIRTRRLAAALHMLTHPAHAGMRIGEIAFRCGFSSEAHFSRVFRSEFEMTPSAVKRRARQEPALITAPLGKGPWISSLSATD
ncbi:AraC family transcriptional regulator [Azorhizobium oxalatiphilum]|uniref:AraC family transcriptional regulator n=1 Tax=Azorhizobium oxalatiphilum TaxID=980631 RepID=A0A917FG47_9HYPH|nr:helix-turn-helix domain-containing protein [Azorhizobium oxalatiphilum]GGF74496.1 AraC family transcriptional regulator [Azorhizobium oxalatiphilum]